MPKAVWVALDCCKKELEMLKLRDKLRFTSWTIKMLKVCVGGASSSLGCELFLRVQLVGRLSGEVVVVRWGALGELLLRSKMMGETDVRQV